ncbi:MAG: glycoside hydrolase family 97 catalytic domain-containing protein [Xanthomonadales bacterium]
MLRKLTFFLLFCSLSAMADSGSRLASPNDGLRLHFDLDDRGRPWFQLLAGDDPLIRPSPLGISLHNTAFVDGLTVAATSGVDPVTDRYRLWTGKRTQAAYRANRWTVTLRNAAGHAVIIAFQLSDDGLAYRYEFPGESDDVRVVTAEHGGVHFVHGTRAWLQPKANARTGWSKVNPSYEEDYLQDIPVGTPSPIESGWVYPALFRYGDTWLVVSETGMDGTFPGSNLAAESPDGLYRIRYPQDAEVITNGKLLGEARLPFHTPWRLLLAGDLATIMDSTLGTDLAEPNVLENTGFIEPGISAWSWGLLKDDYTIYPVQKAFVDYAADMNWPYVLVDADWDQKIGYGKIADLAEYAAGKDVGLLLWYNSSGAWNETVYTPKSRLLTRADRRAEFARLQEMGVRGIKVDFFPGDGASVMQYYVDLLRDAADHELVVNFHGTTLPRGLQRTFPNHLTSEAVKGLEFITFEQANAEREATHSAMLPFTRNLFDPMDFTPMVLGEIPDRQRRTSNGFQLALPVLFTSGIQHLVTTPEQMAQMPGFVKDYLRAMPAMWDDSRFVSGYPGRHVTIARRAGERWYVAAIHAGPVARRFAPDLSFTGRERGQLITDGASWREPAQRNVALDDLAIELEPGTGFVLIID